MTFTYNAEDQRVQKATPVETTGFYYDQNRLLLELDGAGDIELFFTSTTEEFGDLLSEFDGTDTAYHAYDALGSTDALLSDGEAETDKYTYRAFGKLASHSGASETPFTFIGQQNYYTDEELGLYFASVRHLDPATGQWTSKDPIGIEAGDANYYRYVDNNLVNKTDPSGKEEDERKKALQIIEEVKAAYRPTQYPLPAPVRKSWANAGNIIEHVQRLSDIMFRMITFPTK